MERTPPFRKLRGYAFDPSLSLKLETAGINEIVYHVPWEDFGMNPKEGSSSACTPKEVALIGEYLEILDYDPTVGQFYKAVDLNAIFALAQDGLDPSESNPQFHQQMVYAVAMTTINNFEKALGRKVQWAPRRFPKVGGKWRDSEYQQRLRIYPHALRDANAYYSPAKKALLFGYFASMPADASMGMQGSLIFTCLSHDIIAHEITHAILDGIYPYYNESTNPDVLAFHEAFADIVALFQHFTFPTVLKHQIAKTRGDLKTENLLGQLAQEFGQGIGNRGSLRDAIGKVNPKTKRWEKTEPNPTDYQRLTEPHDRGSLLVAAIFEAFTSIYQQRTQDLFRIATNGTGILPAGEMHPDLVNRLAEEAAKVAGHVLSICIRALDYCPPTDITFGNYLRAIITGDIDLVPFDSRNYRVAFIDAFRRRGIYPDGIRSLSEDSLRYRCEPVQDPEVQALFKIIGEYLMLYLAEVGKAKTRQEIYQIGQDFIAPPKTNLRTTSGGEQLGLHHRIMFKFGQSSEFEAITGLVFRGDPSPFGVALANVYGATPGPRTQVTNLRLVSRSGPQGRSINHVVFSLLQRCLVKLDPETGKLTAKVPNDDHSVPEGWIYFRGGCSIVFDLDSQKVKHVISKPILQFPLDAQGNPILAKAELDRSRIEKQYRYQFIDGPNSMSAFHQYFAGSFKNALLEPFCFVHSH